MLIAFLVVVIILLLMVIAYLYRKANNLAYDGDVVVTKYPDGKTVFSLDLSGDPNDIPSKGNLNFKVVQEQNVDFE